MKRYRASASSCTKRPPRHPRPQIPMPARSNFLSKKLLFLIPFGFLIAGIFGVLHFLQPSATAGVKVVLQPQNIALVRQGKAVYLTHCASCHGSNLEGQQNWRQRLPNGMLPAPPHDATGHTWHHSDSYLFMVTKYGIERLIGQTYANAMPIYEGIISDQEILSVLSYIKSTRPGEIKARQDRINARGQR